MRRSLWLSLAVCAVLGAGCQPAGPADKPAAADSAASADVIDAVPLKADTPPPIVEAQTPAPAPAAPPSKAPAAQDAAGSGTRIPEAWDIPRGEVKSCREAIGAAASARLVERCIQVSPATRPPCNAANPCVLIQGEIDRACKLWERDGNPPAECRS
jgi:hypothetical protein